VYQIEAQQHEHIISPHASHNRKHLSNSILKFQ
jgi:hypothetical protein